MVHSKNFSLAADRRKVEVSLNKSVYLGFSILDLKKVEMYEFWYDYIKEKCEATAHLRYIYTYSLIINIKTNNLYGNI